MYRDIGWSEKRKECKMERDCVDWGDKINWLISAVLYNGTLNLP